MYEERNKGRNEWIDIKYRSISTSVMNCTGE